MNYILNERYNFDFMRIQFNDSYHIEYCITDICNRNCVSCSHLAPLAKKPNFVNIEDFAKEINILRKVLPDVHTFWLTGGEPTLHPKFLDLLFILRNTFQNCFVGIYSNGQFLEKYIDNKIFWEFVKLNGIVWAITNYDCDSEYLDAIFKENGCFNNLAYVHNGKRFFNLTNYSKNQPVSLDKYQKCGWEKSKINIRNGRIFNCPSAEFADLFNDYFDFDIKLSDTDYLVIDERLTRDMIEKFRGPVPFCANCDLTQRYKKFFINTNSKKEIQEWSNFKQEIK